MYPIIHLFGRDIGAYGVAGTTGMLVAAFVAFFLAKKRTKVAVEDLILFAVAVGVGLIVGGHLLYGVTNLPMIVNAFKNISSVPFKQTFDTLVDAFNGMVFYGGLFGAILGAFLVTKWDKDLERSVIFDVFAVVIPLFHVFGRIGCFFAGCCYGVECSWGVLIEHNDIVPGVAGVPRFPVQLVEAACNLLLFILLFILYKKRYKQGRLIFVYLPLYAAVRFVLEFFRGDVYRGVFWGLSTSQWISLLIIAFCLIRQLVLRSKRVGASETPKETGDTAQNG